MRRPGKDMDRLSNYGVQRLNSKRYTSGERDLIYDWADRWLDLTTLINDVTGTDEPPWSPPPPTDLEELQYQNLRFWFFDHQVQFVPLWENFCECQERASRQDCDIQDIDGYLETPFFYFYEPENLLQLSRQLGLQSGIDIWEPSEYQACMIRPVMIMMGKIMIEFTDWISERTSDSE